MQDDDSIICGFCCIAFTECMLPGKFLLDYANLFSRNDYKKMIKQYISTLETNITRFDFRLTK